MDQVRHHLKKISTDLADDDFENLELKFEKEQKKDSSERFMRYYKPRNKKSDEFPDLDEKQFFMVLMNDFQMEMVKNFNRQKERVITMDATFGLNNKKVLLITLMMIDEYGNGVPLAFCLSEHENESTIAAFLNCVFKLVGKINCEFFMSDDAHQYYNAWKRINGDATKILCSWHVYKNWKQQVKKIVKNPKKQEEILKELIGIRDAPDIDTAKSKLNSLIRDLESKQSTKEFAKYIKSYYLKRMDQWLYCCRRSLIPNTNMHVEALHRLIKVIFLSCKRINRISRCIEMLNEIVQQKMIDRVVKTQHRRNDKKTHTTFERHRTAEQQIEKYDLSLFYIDDESQDRIFEIVKSDKTKYYVTQKKLDDKHSCEHSCKWCTACVHYFECTCYNYRNSPGDLCKHIHMIAIDFEIMCCNIVNEPFNADQHLFDQIEYNDTPSITTIEMLSNKEEDLNLLVDDLNFLQQKCGDLIKKFTQEKNIDKLTEMKSKLKRSLTSFIEIDSTGLEEEHTRERKMRKQNRYF